jgi:hypothetical protein
MFHISKSLAVTADTLFWGKNTLSATAESMFRMSKSLSAAADTPFLGKNTPSATDATIFQMSFALSAATDDNSSFKIRQRMKILTIHFIMDMNAETRCIASLRQLPDSGALTFFPGSPGVPL